MSTRTKSVPTAAAVRLSPTSYLVLGLIGLRGASTPYDLKRAVSRTVSYFWPFPHAALRRAGQVGRNGSAFAQGRKRRPPSQGLHPDEGRAPRVAGLGEVAARRDF